MDNESYFNFLNEMDDEENNVKKIYSVKSMCIL